MLERPHSAEGDPASQRKLCAGMTFTPSPGLRLHIAARTAFVDGQVMAAIAAGIAQVVICGAAYDDRALRFRTSGVRFFELDHPETQRHKAARLLAMGIGAEDVMLGPADFRYDDVVTVLARVGHDASQPSLFICEGLLTYLDGQTCHRLLAALADRGAAGSVLAASLSTHADGADSSVVVAEANRSRRTSGAEPWRTILPVAEHLARAERADWVVTKNTVGAGQFRPRQSQPPSTAGAGESGRALTFSTAHLRAPWPACTELLTACDETVACASGESATEREKVSRMETTAFDFTAWGLDADWPALRWIEPINGRRGQPVRGVRLGHADDSAMVLTCTYPRSRFDSEARGCGSDPVREIAFETTYTQVNLAVHQMREPAERPDGLIGSLVSHASQEADRYRDWSVARWGDQEASTTRLANWQSGFTAADPAAYVIVHACGIAIEDVRLTTVRDLYGYEASRNQAATGDMHWELWPSRPDVGYDDLVGVLAG